jgi:solute carrier family 34 (sodium-dependent phosphate cotransporter)
VKTETDLSEHINSTSLTRTERFRVGLYLVLTLVLFIFAINLMVSSLHNLGDSLSDTILLATANPFNGLFIGLLVTAILQSSSTTTSLLVAFVASSAMTVEGAVPIIMGANIGTTITSTIVSLGFISKKKEFQRAVAAGTYHDFFNILTAAVLFPLEYYYQTLSRISRYFANLIVVDEPAQGIAPIEGFSLGLHPLVKWFHSIIPYGWILVLLSIAILFLSILLFRRIVANLLKVKHPEFFRKFLFANPLKSFAWGIALTAVIRSSTITTSLVVPIVAKNMVSLRKASSFILGANIGTTITAFIAVLLYADSSEAIIIGLVHLAFNVIGVILFFAIPYLREIPLELARSLGKLTIRYRISGFVYLLCTFFIIPFLLIAFHRNPVKGPGSALENIRNKHRVTILTRHGKWNQTQPSGLGNVLEIRPR